MTTPPQTTAPTSGWSREAQAAAELGSTEISPGVAKTLVGLSSLILLAVPLSEWAGHLGEYASGEQPSPWPPSTQILEAPTLMISTWSQHEGSPVGRTLAANAALMAEIDRYETSLADSSFTSTHLLPSTRSLLARFARWGSDDAWIGPGRFVFFGSDLDYSTGPGFLSPSVLEVRRRAGREFSEPVIPDPRPAILDFASQLAEQGIHLVLVPTPTKAMVHPEQCGIPSTETGLNFHNISMERLVQDLESQHITLFDPLSLLKRRAVETRNPQFLATDTHWRPEAMQAVAAALADTIRKTGRLAPAARSRNWVTRQKTVRGRGDLAAMLRLDAELSRMTSEKVSVTEVLTTDHQAWEPETGAEVLLLGDSYTNIYSLSPMGWGRSAGLAEHLALGLGRPVDRLARNADGSFATRQQLSRDPGRLASTRVVVWQFAVRELSSGHWPLITLEPNRSQTGKSPEQKPVASFTVLARSDVPRPGSVPYRDAVLAIHARDEQGTEHVIYMMSMKDNRLTPVAELRPGDTLTVGLVPWTTVSKTHARLNRTELDDPNFRLVDLPTHWGELP